MCFEIPFSRPSLRPARCNACCTGLVWAAHQTFANHSAALLRSLHKCTSTCNLRIVIRVALPTISIHCCWLKNKRKIQIGSHITAIQQTLFCSLMLGVHMVAVKGSLVLFTGPCQPVNGQLSLLLPALTMVHSAIVFGALWF